MITMMNEFSLEAANSVCVCGGESITSHRDRQTDRQTDRQREREIETENGESNSNLLLLCLILRILLHF